MGMLLNRDKISLAITNKTRTNDNILAVIPEHTWHFLHFISHKIKDSGFE